MTQQKISWRHHYVPQFYIKNFYNHENAIYVYDKIKDSYLPYPRSSKTIFFEKERNTLLLNSKKDDLVEQLFKWPDNKLSDQFKKVKSYSKDALENDLAYLSALQIFITWTLWRLPCYDEETKKYIQNNIEELESTYSEKYKNITILLDDKSKIKFYRALIPFDILNKEEAVKTPNGIQYYKIYQHPKEAFIISDNPLIIKYHPKFESDLKIPCVLPLSSNRLYLALDNRQYSINNQIIKLINFLIIYNAEQYVAGPNKEFLDYYLYLYKDLGKLNNQIIQGFKEELWILLNKK